MQKEAKKFLVYNRNMVLILSFVLLMYLLTHSFDFFVWIVNVPLLLLIYNKPIKRALLLAASASFIAAGISLMWVTKYDLETYALASIVITSFLVVFAFLFNLLSKKIQGYLSLFIAPFLWSTLQILFSYGLIDTFWADYSIFYPITAPLIWFVGSNGITFLIILMHSVIAFYLLKRDKKALLTGIFIIVILFGNYIYGYNAKPEGQKIKVALLQGNFNQDWNWRNINAKGLIFNVYTNLSIEASKSNPDIIIWPEYALADDISKDKNLISKISNLAKQANAYLVLGTLKFLDTFYEDIRERNDIALIFTRRGELISEYNSIKPFPHDKWVLPGNMSNYTFNTSIGKFGISLCYEETQKNIPKEFAQEGAQFLISLSNNLALDKTAGFYLASLYTNLRAAENGKYLIRATNTGITKIVNPYGKVEAQLQPYTRGILIGDIYLNDKTTFYTKYGNLILYVVLIVFGILFLRKLVF